MADASTEVVDSPNGDGPTVFTSRKASPEDTLRPGESDTVEFVEGLYSEAEQARRDLCDPDTWPSNSEIYWGNQWPGTLPSYKPRIVINEIKSLILQELSDLTDSRIELYVQKDRNSDAPDPMVERSLKSYWRRRFCDMTAMAAALDAMVYPLGFFQSGWNPAAEQGQGEVTLIARDPVSVYPDADAVDDDTLRYFVLEDILDITEIRRNWKETGWRVNPEAAYSLRLDGQKDRPAPRAGSGYTGPLYSKTTMSGVPGYKKARARVLTCVVEDDDTIEEVREMQGRLVQLKVQKYPHKRLIIVGNQRVLYDADCAYHYAPMLTRVALQPTGHAYWPMSSVVSEFAEIQSTANKMDSMVAENALRLNVGIVFTDADSGINTKTFGGIPGAVHQVKPGSRTEIKYPQPMPPDMIQAGERLRGMIRSNMGYPLSRTGAGTHGNVAAELAETEISQSMGLTRLRGRLLHYSVQRAVEMIFARMAQFYTTPRHLPYLEDGKWQTVKWEPVVAPENYVVHVDEASFQVRSQTMMNRIALGLAKMNKLPTGRLLKMLKFPDADKIAEELKQELVLAAAARMKQRGKK